MKKTNDNPELGKGELNLPPPLAQKRSFRFGNIFKRKTPEIPKPEGDKKKLLEQKYARWKELSEKGEKLETLGGVKSKKMFGFLRRKPTKPNSLDDNRILEEKYAKWKELSEKREKLDKSSESTIKVKSPEKKQFGFFKHKPKEIPGGDKKPLEKKFSKWKEVSEKREKPETAPKPPVEVKSIYKGSIGGKILGIFKHRPKENLNVLDVKDKQQKSIMKKIDALKKDTVKEKQPFLKRIQGAFKKKGEVNKTPGKQKGPKINPRKKFAAWIEKSGILLTRDKISKILFNATLFFTLILSGYVILRSAGSEDFSLTYALVILLFIWTLGFAAILMSLWLILYIVVDYKIYLRKVGIEEVFPDFLQLTSANIRSGMPIDQALWHAIRPNFGVLAKEMADVAKQTMSGTDLEKALQDFAAKYDSTLLKRS
ncbi:MAG: hypothetical protein ABIA37_01595, partial [Candidatus Woesearchaeota archaeon]